MACSGGTKMDISPRSSGNYFLGVQYGTWGHRPWELCQNIPNTEKLSRVLSASCSNFYSWPLKPSMTSTFDLIPLKCNGHIGSAKDCESMMKLANNLGSWAGRVYIIFSAPVWSSILTYSGNICRCDNLQNLNSGFPGLSSLSQTITVFRDRPFNNWRGG